MYGCNKLFMCFILVICLGCVLQTYHCLYHAFRREESLDNTICQDPDLIINEGPVNSLQCVRLCDSMASECIGVWYSTNGSGQCHGCSRMENTIRIPENNTVAYRRIDCSNYMVANVNDSQLSASSYYGDPNPTHMAKFARLHTVVLSYGTGGWSSKTDDVNPFIQVDFLWLRRVTGVAIQGRDNANQWVREFRVMISVDCVVFVYVTDAFGQVKLFPGNTDWNTVVVNEFSSTKIARCVRIYPTLFYVHISLRFDVIGCQF